MSALAEAALQQGHAVTGSDRLLDSGQETQVLSALKHLGASLFPQDGSGIAADTDAVVVSTAIEQDNPDLRTAEEAGTKVLHRSDMLGLLTEAQGRRFAVSGTCGKSTVTGLAGWLLSELGKDPTVINGAPLADWMDQETVGSARLGKGGVCVFEADESDRSLLNYGCDTAIITNSSADHFSLEETDALFDQFAERAQVVLDARRETFFSDCDMKDMGFNYKSVFFEVPMPGQHNVLNAAIAVKLCEHGGCDLRHLSHSLRDFRGISRRLELVGRRSGVSVYDDYAHNTEKIRAVWRTLAGRHSSVCGIWRPHGYGPLRSMMGDLDDMFTEVLRDQDRLVLLPVYDAGGTADRSVNSGELVERLSEKGKRVILAGRADDAAAEIADAAPDAVVTLGARDPDLPNLARRILRAL
jgi:UDP-N-acetylmuramate--alanine ligase